MISKLKEKFVDAVSLEGGFTLIELMIVIAIIGVLAAVAIPQMTGVKETANIGGAEAELKSLQTIMEMYYVRNDSYPAGTNVTIASLGLSEVTPGMETGPRGVDYEYTQVSSGQEWKAMWENPDNPNSRSVLVTEDAVEKQFDASTF